MEWTIYDSRFRETCLSFQNPGAYGALWSDGVFYGHEYGGKEDNPGGWRKVRENATLEIKTQIPTS